MPDEKKPVDLGDRARLEEIAELDLLGPGVDEILQATAEEAAERLRLPMSLVSVVTDQAQFFAAHHGLTGWLREARGTPAEWSFCANAVRSGEPFVVEDARTHPLVRENPLVTEDGIRCYAGIPLVTTRGHALGTCASWAPSPAPSPPTRWTPSAPWPPAPSSASRRGAGAGERPQMREVGS
jgi:hypothetical protein